MRRQLPVAVGMVLLFTAICGIMYPLFIVAASQVAFPITANGQLIRQGGAVVGSRLLGQSFQADRYFHPRPSSVNYAAGPDPAHGSNEGPLSSRFLNGDDGSGSTAGASRTDGVDDRISAYRQENRLGTDAVVPVDAVTGSASGLDPHISVANARLQARRVALARGLPEKTVLSIMKRFTSGRTLGILGEPRVNVVELNLALDRR